MIFSFFAGAGFLDLGFEHSGYDIAFVNEIHKPFMKTYQHSRRILSLPTPRYGYWEGDIASYLEPSNRSWLQQLVRESVSSNDIVGFIGGPPCPDFSVGGKNRGRTGDNGKLTATYVELICQQRPAFFLFENVKGLWRTKKHRDFYEEMKRKLETAGYRLTERLIDALEFGAPQRRERIILIGFRSDFLGDIGVRPAANDMNWLVPWSRYIRFSAERLAQIAWPISNHFREDSALPRPSGIPEELTVQNWFVANDVLNHPNADQHFAPRAGLSKFRVIDEGDDSKKSYKRLHRWRYSPTAAYGNNEVHLHPYKARRLSISEALAIQSLPRKYELPQDMTLSNAFKTVGNGVPYLAAKALAQTILDVLEGKICDSLPQISSQQ